MCDSKVVTIIGIFLQCRNGVLEDALKDVFDIVLVNVLYSSVLYSSTRVTIIGIFLQCRKGVLEDA